MSEMEEPSKDRSDATDSIVGASGEPLSSQELRGLYDLATKIGKAAEDAILAAVGKETVIRLAGMDWPSQTEALQGLSGSQFVIEGTASLANGVVAPWLILVKEEDAAFLAPSGDATEEALPVEAIIERLKAIGCAFVEEGNSVLRSQGDANKLSFSSTRLGSPTVLISLAFSGGLGLARITCTLEVAGREPCQVTTLLPQEAVPHLSALAPEEGGSTASGAEFTAAPGFGIDVAAEEQPGQPIKGRQPSARAAQFVPFSEPRRIGSPNSIDLILDVSLRISVELGRAMLPIREVLELGPGSVVELDKLAGEPVDILANDRVIAKGEVVVVDENFGVRLTEILAPARRLQTGQQLAV